VFCKVIICLPVSVCSMSWYECWIRSALCTIYPGSLGWQVDVCLVCRPGEIDRRLGRETTQGTDDYLYLLSAFVVSRSRRDLVRIRPTRVNMTPGLALIIYTFKRMPASLGRIGRQVFYLPKVPR